MEILRIHIQLGETLALDSFSAGIRMIPFTGTCESSIFNGTVLPGGIDTQVFPEKNRGTLNLLGKMLVWIWFTWVWNPVLTKC